MKIAAVLTATLALSRSVAAQNSSICISDTNTYTVIVDLYAGELGYFTFEECPGLIMPTIGIEIGETYTFVQKDRSNYYHPMGFAYFPDGDHDDKAELEPVIAPYGTNSTCNETATCPAPMYFHNGTYLGKYSNNADVLNVTENEEDFGLDVYEPLYYHPLPEWVGLGTFEVKLRFDEPSFQNDIFYFCHIHQYMSGRIKLLSGGVPVQPDDIPGVPYHYDEPSEFDAACGTYGLDAFQLPHPECPDRFVCGVPDNNTALAQFSSCIDAMDCHMMAGMTTGVQSGSETALFVHQMVPHHQNAVNMAKAVLKTGKVDCDDLTSESDMCILENILRDIVNNQNYQIQVMYEIVKSLGYPQQDDCEVLVDGTNVTDPSGPTAAPGTTNGASSTSSSARINVGNLMTLVTAAVIMSLLWL